MIENLLGMSIEEIKNGYTYDKETHMYSCHICGRAFEDGEIFKVDDRYFEACKMVKIHVQKDHPDMLELLISTDKKMTGITENQKELLNLMYSRTSDNEIAKMTGVASATIRHQRFVFREKAKQAKLFLSIYELVIEGKEKGITLSNEGDDMINIHRGATMVDDRYCITKAEEEKILATMFSSLSPLKLKTFSTKEKKKLVVLRKIIEQFERHKRYTEKELNAIIKEIYEDVATIRRYFIEYGFMERTTDCKEYWVK